MPKMWIEQMNVILINLYLFWGSIQDIKKRKISNVYLWIGGIGGFAFKIIGFNYGLQEIGDWILTAVPGLLVLFLGKKTKEKIGLGDGLVLLVLANIMTFIEICILLQIAIFLLLIFALVLLSSRKFSKDYPIPFLPFLWLSHLLLWRIGYV